VTKTPILIFLINNEVDLSNQPKLNELPAKSGLLEGGVIPNLYQNTNSGLRVTSISHLICQAIIQINFHRFVDLKFPHQTKKP